jgi:hypothetical protein
VKSFWQVAVSVSYLTVTHFRYYLNKISGFALKAKPLIAKRRWHQK